MTFRVSEPKASHGENILQRLTSGTLLFSKGTLRSERCCFLGCSAPLLTWQVNTEEQVQAERIQCKINMNSKRVSQCTHCFSSGMQRFRWEAMLWATHVGVLECAGRPLEDLGERAALLNLDKDEMLTLECNYLKGEALF